MKRPIEPLSREEVQQLIAHCGTNARRWPTPARNRAIVAVLWRCGLRRMELLNLWPADIDREKSTLRVRRGKGGRARLVAIDAETGAHLDLWDHHRAKLSFGLNTPYFPGISGEARGMKLGRTGLEKSIKLAAKKAGISKRIHYHGFRHTFAVELSEENVPINIISKALGHSNSGTTAIYLDHVAAPQVVDALRCRRWNNPNKEST